MKKSVDVILANSAARRELVRPLLMAALMLTLALSPAFAAGVNNGFDTVQGNLNLAAQGKVAITATPQGMVGIGTMTPTQTTLSQVLDVNGDTTINGNQTVQGNVNVSGSINVSQVSVAALQSKCPQGGTIILNSGGFLDCTPTNTNTNNSNGNNSNSSNPSPNTTNNNSGGNTSSPPNTTTTDE